MPSFTVAMCVVILMTSHQASARCDTSIGPSGTVDCIRIGRYGFEPQLATCLTDAYIQAKSKGRHQCEDRFVAYCYYQCQLEVFGDNVGSVNPACSCDQDTTPCPNKGDEQLPAKCFSPDGSDCSWYRDCLEARYDCTGGDDDYGIAYAEKFCNLYYDNYNDFTPLGQSWVDATRKCLQVELVPLLRPFECPECKDIKARAFHSHSGCYVRPYDGAPSVCELPPGDFWSIFWTIKSAFSSDFVESLFGMLQVGGKCAESWTEQAYDNTRRLMVDVALPKVLRFYHSIRDRRSPHGSRYRRNYFEDLYENVESSVADFASLRQSSRVQRSANYTIITPSPSPTPSPGDAEWRGESDEALYYHRTAGALAQQLAHQLHWTSLPLRYFASGAYDDVTDVLRLDILLADAARNASSSSLNLTRVVSLAAESFAKGEVKMEAKGVWLTGGRLIGCRDLACRHAFFNVTGRFVTGAAGRPAGSWVGAVFGLTVLAGVWLAFCF